MLGAADFVLIEGAGGWRVPINARETLADLAVQLQVGVILVVGMRLGCINHALLTAEAIAAMAWNWPAGWPTSRERDALSRGKPGHLAALLPAPLLGESLLVPFDAQRRREAFY